MNLRVATSKYLSANIHSFIIRFLLLFLPFYWLCFGPDYLKAFSESKMFKIYKMLIVWDSNVLVSTELTVLFFKVKGGKII